jgi:hypothetical protein
MPPTILEMVQPEWQHALHPLAAGLLHVQPAMFGNSKDRLAIEDRNSSPTKAFAGALPVAEHLDGLLATIAGHLAEVVEKTAADDLARQPLVAAANPGNVFIKTAFAHRGGHWPRCPQL